MTAHLEILNLNVRFGLVHALRDVSLTLERGTKLGLVGESGSGKSTLGLAVLGLLSEKATRNGAVAFNGAELPWHDDAAMTMIRGRKIGFIYQDPMSSFSPIHTIGVHLGRALKAGQPGMSRGEVRERSVALLEEVEIPRAAERLGHYPHEYSGGMRQRVMIAAALANDPELLIADEPTTALDVSTQLSVLKLFNHIVESRQMSFILVTHDLGVVSAACRDVAVMYAGRIVHRTTVSRIRSDPLHPYSKALLEARPHMDTVVGRLRTIPSCDEKLLTNGGCAFEPRCWKGNGRDNCRTATPLLLPHASGDLCACHYPGKDRNHA